MDSSSNTSSSSDSSDFEDLLFLQEIEHMYNKSPHSTSKLSGREYLQEVLDGPPDKFFRVFRMNKDCFLALCQFIINGNYLQEMPEEIQKRHLSHHESVAIFLYIVCHSQRMRLACDRFDHSLETIQRHFTDVLKGLVRASTVLITPPNTTHVHERISGSTDFYPWFKGAIGAADGTLINASVPASRQNTCRGRKGDICQNVLAVCDFDMMFTFVYAGWEGSANDSRVIHSALTKGLLPIPPDDKYYLVDCGYTNMPGFLAPYRGEPYHLQDFQGPNHAPTQYKQLFNKQHARLRNVIERTFGVFKKRFAIFKSMTNYLYTRQVMMVPACCAVHNFIRRYSADDAFFSDLEDEQNNHLHNQDNASTSQPLDMSSSQLNRMNTKRDQIAMAMWNARH